MKWKPISENEIWQEINASWERMSLPQRRLWEVIRILPEKWKLDPWGNKGKGFWVVAIIGRSVVWYNDIEDGFNRSRYSKFGQIEDYWCNQDTLEWTLQHIIDEIREGSPSEWNLGPPQPLT